MTNSFTSALTRFLREEAGTSTVEFVLIMPAYVALLMMSVELGFITLRATLLERGLDMAVRDIRLGTGTAPQHDAIKALVCKNALMVRDCEQNLRLEMRPADIRNLTLMSGPPDCTDTAEPTRPVREFSPGQENQLMVLRACLKYDPIFPSAVLSRALTKDSSGQAAIVSTTAFVQEPS